MKKELRDIFFVASITFVLAFGFVSSAILINLNAFSNAKKSITLQIHYANQSYEYKHIRTDAENLHDVLFEYNDRLSLSIIVSGTETDTTIFSLKSTDISASKHHFYQITLNEQPTVDDLQQILISDGDVVSIDYINKSTDKSISPHLVFGGDNKPTFYFKVSIALYTLTGALIVLVAVYIVIALIKIKRDNEIAAAHLKKIAL